MWNGYPVKIIGGTEVGINDKKDNLILGIKKVLVNISYKSAQLMNDEDKVAFRDMLQKTKRSKHKLTKRRISSRDR